MAERDVIYYGVYATGTSDLLGDSSYPTIIQDLTQDFNIQRVSKGLDSINLQVDYKDINGNYIEPSGQVYISIYDVLKNLIVYTTETRVASGQYQYTYTPPVSADVGIYQVLHSTTISGSALETEDYFKVVSSAPGSYYGKILRGEDSVTVTLSNESLQEIDPGTSIRVVIISPTGVTLVNTTCNGIYTYSPGYNDYDGDFEVYFITTVRGVQQIEKSFFTVVLRREENLVTAEDFKKSLETYRFRNSISKMTDEQIDNTIADAQAIASQYVGYPISNKVINGEKASISTDYKGFLYLRPRAKNITKLIRCQLRYHPQVSITLPVSGFLIDNDTGVIKYIYSGGMIIPGSIRGLLNEYSYDNWYEAIISYEIGFVNDELIKLKKAIRLLTADMIQQGFGLYDIKEVKSGNYTEQYYDSLRSSGKRDVDGMTPLQKEAFRILGYFKRAPIA